MNKSGLILVLTGFAFFLLAPLLTNHKLTSNHIYSAIKDKGLAAEVSNQMQPVLGQKISNLRLQSVIGTALSSANESTTRKYSLTDEQLALLGELMLQNKLSDASVDSLFTGESLAFQRKSFKDYGSWLYGRAFANREAAISALSEIKGNIATYEIEAKLGFDRYKRKAIRYDLARLSVAGWPIEHPVIYLFLSYGLAILGALFFAIAQLGRKPGINNDNVFRNPVTSRKWAAIMIGSFLIGFYILLYFFPEYMVSWIRIVDPISEQLSGNPAGQFFLYGFLYTLAVLVMGIRMLIKYRHNRYQIIRTTSVMFFQTAFAFLIPEILVRLNKPYFDFKNIWPLDYDFFFDFELDKLVAQGNLGIFMLGWGIALALIGVPLFTYLFGKRWYCSWVCGCGGLAETLGDPFRHLSDKRLKAWYFEQVSIYSVLVFAVVMTAAVLYTYFTGNATLMGINSYSLRETYGVFIGAGFAGVIGTGFYPIMGNRVWCRFGCPLAGYMGIIQRFKSRFRITTNGGQCISCGNCSTYCEMGIDVRSYAQKGENIVRASCVGCGVCAAVCPRGVLKLENNGDSARLQANGFIK